MKKFGIRNAEFGTRNSDCAHPSGRESGGIAPAGVGYTRPGDPIGTKKIESSVQRIEGNSANSGTGTPMTEKIACNADEPIPRRMGRGGSEFRIPNSEFERLGCAA
jgi:hypothetical protein